MAKGRMNFDQFEGDEMNYIPKDFMKEGEEKKKVLKMKKENIEKSKGRIENNRKTNEYININEKMGY
ncbi:MAG: hypothetical protein ACRC6Z_07595 [Cetobacterium sp.]